MIGSVGVEQKILKDLIGVTPSSFSSPWSCWLDVCCCPRLLGASAHLRYSEHGELGSFGTRRSDRLPGRKLIGSVIFSFSGLFLSFWVPQAPLEKSYRGEILSEPTVMDRCPSTSAVAQHYPGREFQGAKGRGRSKATRIEAINFRLTAFSSSFSTLEKDQKKELS